MTTQATELMKESAEVIALKIDSYGTGQPEYLVAKDILNYKLQKELVKETRNLVIATWVLVVITASLSVLTLLFR